MKKQKVDDKEFLKQKIRQGATRSRLSFVEVGARVDFDDLLPHIGEFGAFQIYLFCMTIPFMYFVAVVYLGQIFITLKPDEYYCHLPELRLLSEERRKELVIPKEDDGSYSKCFMYNVNFTDLAKNPNAKVNTSLPKIPCKYGYDFNFTKIPYPTIVTELGWVCDKDRYATYALIIFFLGSACGGFFYGHMADHMGRIMSLVSCNMLGFFGGILTSYASNFKVFCLARFIVGAAYDNCFTLMYILLLEYVGPKYRTWVGNMSIGLFYTPASCAMPWLALGIGNWRRFIRWTSAPIALSLLATCLLPESARWLVSTGRVDDALVLLKKIAKTNKKTVDNEVYEHFHYCCIRFHAEEVSYRRNTIFQVFRSLRLFNVTILLIIIWGIMSLVYDGHVRAINTVGTDIFITFTVASATELPADIFLVLILDRIGRRWTSFFVMFASGVLTIIAAQLTSNVMIAMVAIMGRFFANICYNVGLQFAAEILPTVVRAQGLALIHIMGYVATMFSPIILYMAHISPSLPLDIIGLLGVIGAFLAFLLPETLNRELPQTLSEGERFLKSSKLCGSPCCKTREQGTTTHWHSGSSLRSTYGAEFRSDLLHRVAGQKKTTVLMRSDVSDDNINEEVLDRTVYKQLQKEPT